MPMPGSKLCSLILRHYNTFMLKIYLLGTFYITIDDNPVPESAWHTRQARQLLKILLTHRGKIVPRDALIDALWRDADPHKAATTLRTAINALRKTLEPNRPPYTPSSFIVAHAPGYKFELTGQVWVDAIQFDTWLDEAEHAADDAEQQALLERALALYRDDYLCDDLYDDWTVAERDRLYERYLWALAAQAEILARRGDYDRAIAGLRRVIARDPGREPVYRTLMRYHMRQGDMVAALKAFEQLRHYLATELGADPSPQTLALHQAILNGQLPEPSAPVVPETIATSPLETVFVGRQAELKQLIRVLDALTQLHGRMICLTGESGVGKTTLAGMLLRRADSAQVTILTAHCQLAEQSLPFAPIVAALESYMRRSQPQLLNRLSAPERVQLAPLFPSLAWQLDTDPTPDDFSELNRRLVVAGLVKLLLVVARQPVVLFIDDLQWVDEATLTLLANLSRYVPQSPLLVLMAYRPEDVPEDAPLNRFLRDLTHRHALESIRLDRLSESETATFLQTVIAAQSPKIAPAARQLHHLTGGNPLFITETIRAWQDAHAQPLDTADPESLLTDALLQPSPHVTDIILARLAHLPADARAILDIGAVIGRDFSVDLLEAIATTDPLAALTELLRRQFLVEISPARLDFSHQIVREVVYRQLSPVARRRLHQRVAAGLTSLFGKQAGPRAAEIAEHSLRAGASARTQALNFSVLAGDYALRAFGFEQAVHHYRQALTVAENMPPSETAPWVRRAYRGLGQAQESLMAWNDARETYRRCRMWAQRTGNRTAALMAQYRLAAMLGLIGELEESAALTARIAKELPPETPPVVVSAQHRLRLLSLTRETPPTWTESGFPVFQPQPLTTARPWESLAAFLGEEQSAQTLNLYGWTLTLQGETSAAEETLNLAAQLAETYNQRGAQATAAHLMAQLWDMRGEYGQMTHALNRALALVEDIPHLRWIVIWGRIHRAYVDVRWNRLDRAAERFRQMETELSAHTALRSHWLSVQVGLGLLAMFRGETEAAARYFDIARGNLQNLYASNYVALNVSLARLHRHRGEFDAAERSLVQAMAFAAERGMLADYISALVEASRFSQATDQPAEVLHLLQRAETDATRAELLPARLSVRMALYRTFGQMGLLRDAAWFKRLARADRDAIAATIPDAADRTAYLSRQDLRRL